MAEEEDAEWVWNEELQDYVYKVDEIGAFGQNVLPKRKRLRQLLQGFYEDDKHFVPAQIQQWKKIDVEDPEDEDHRWEWEAPIKAKVFHKRRKKSDAVLQMLKDAANKRKAKEEKIKKEKAQRLKEEITVNEKHIVKDNVYCMWKGFVGSDTYYCTNARPVDEDGEFTHRYCSYHTEECKVCKKHIFAPNSAQLCRTHFKEKFNKPPFIFKKLRVPGVRKVNSLKLKAIAIQTTQKSVASLLVSKDENEKEVEEIGERKKCTWIGKNKQGVRYRCTNDCIRHRTNNALLPVCGFHQEICCLPHGGLQQKIGIRNECGICVPHYLAEKGKRPKEYGKLNFPGAEIIKPPRKEKVKRHILAPRGKPPDDVRKKEIREARKKLGIKSTDFDMFDDDFTMPKPDMLDKLFGKVDKGVKAFRRYLIGKRVATKLQKFVRGNIMRKKYRLLLDQKLAAERNRAATSIQKIVRNVIHTRIKKEWNKNRDHAIIVYQRVGRGFLIRNRHRKKYASQMIQRNVRAMLGRIKAMRLRMARLANDNTQDRLWATYVIQSLFRGKRGRRKFREKLNEFKDQTRSAEILQSLFRGRKTRQKVSVKKKAHDMKYKVILFFQSRYRAKKGRQEFKQIFVDKTCAATIIQCAWRFYFAHQRADEERTKIQQIWKWFNPSQSLDSFKYMMPKSRYGKIIPRPHTTRPHTLVERIAVESLGNFKEEFHEEEKDRASTAPTTSSAEGLQFIDSNVLYRINGNPQPGTFESNLPIAWSFDAFKQYDPSGSGHVTKEHFRAVMRKFGLMLSHEESFRICDRYDAFNNGLVDYESFIEFAGRQSTPCTAHRRWACPECVVYGKCLKCDCCDRFTQDKRMLSSSITICKCGHSRSLHSWDPKERIDHIYEKGVPITKKHMKRMLRAPQPMPKRDIRNLLEKGVERENTALQIRFSRKDLKVGTNNKDEDEDGDITPRYGDKAIVIKVASRNDKTDTKVMEDYRNLCEDIVDQVIQENKNIQNAATWVPGWNSCTDPKLRRIGDSKRSSTTTDVGAIEKVELPAGYATHANIEVKKSDEVDYQSPNMIRSINAVARSQKEILHRHVDGNVVELNEFQDTFKIQNPVPVVIEGFLGHSVNVESMYIDILLTFVDKELRILDDSPACVAYILNCLVFLDRHWKKIVRDIRNGTLNKKLQIQPNLRAKIEAILSPEPEIAKSLEDVLRRLNFHERASNAAVTTVLGKSDKSSLAKSKKLGSMIVPEAKAIKKNVRPVITRRHSVADIDIEKERRRRNLKQGDVENPLSLTDVFNASSSFSTNSELSLMTTLASSVSSMREVLPVKRPLSARDIDDVNRILSDSTVGGRSHNDAYFVESFQRFASEPRNEPLPIVREKSRSTRPFVCQFPGCAKSFTDFRIMQMHAKEEHFDKPRLRRNVPQLDQFLQGFWPRDVPWQNYSKLELEKAHDIAMIGVKHVCKRCHPEKRFSLKKNYDTHMKRVHNIQKIESISVDSNISWIGRSFLAPPVRLPSRIKVNKYCPVHWRKWDTNCRKCVELMKQKQIFLPATMYEGVTINYNNLTFVVENGTENNGHTALVRVPESPDDNPEYRFVNIIALLRDNHNTIHFACAYYYDYKTISSINCKVSLRIDFDRKFELVEDEEVVLLPYSAVVDEGFVLLISLHRFTDLRYKDILPIPEDARSDVDPKIRRVHFCRDMLNKDRTAFLSRGSQKYRRSTFVNEFIHD